MSLKKFLFLLALLAPAGPATAQEPDRFGVWQYDCDRGVCQAYFGVRDAERDETVASLTLLRDRANDRGSLMVEVPIQAALPPGVRLSAGETTRDIPFQFCRPEGCVAIATLEPELIDALSDADRASLTFVRYGSGQPERYELPVNGFADAYRRLGEDG